MFPIHSLQARQGHAFARLFSSDLTEAGLDTGCTLNPNQCCHVFRRQAQRTACSQYACCFVHLLVHSLRHTAVHVVQPYMLPLPCMLDAPMCMLPLTCVLALQPSSLRLQRKLAVLMRPLSQPKLNNLFVLFFRLFLWSFKLRLLLCVVFTPKFGRSKLKLDI